LPTDLLSAKKFAAECREHRVGSVQFPAICKISLALDAFRL
jgi:hypothetical protein